MIFKPIKGDEWAVYHLNPFNVEPILFMDSNNIQKFASATRKKSHFVKPEYIDLLYKQPLDGFAVFKSIFIVEGDRLLKLYVDYQGSYGLYTCNENGWSDRCISYGI